MIIFVLNCGSSSIKYKLINMGDKVILASGMVERIGIKGSTLVHQAQGSKKIKIEGDVADHKVAIKMILAALVDPQHGVLKSIQEIDAVGHRVVHGGERFADSCLINDKVIQDIEACCELAPLHNPPNILGIEACKKVLPGIPQAAVFDTAFHQSMPDYAYIYGLPYDAYEKFGVRRYGFHGISHMYVSRRAAKLIGESIFNLRIITCHLGSGSSIAAVKFGKVIDTSMGLTPLDGLVMGTRCGEIDPAIVAFLMHKEKLTAEEMDVYLNKKSGILGISGVSSDFRDIEAGYDAGNDRCRLAWQLYAYRVRKTIGSYVAAMGGVDAIVFTAGLGENSARMRRDICDGLSYLGTCIDEKKNSYHGREVEISPNRSKVQIFVIPTNEEIVIANDTARLCKALLKNQANEE